MRVEKKSRQLKSSENFNHSVFMASHDEASTCAHVQVVPFRCQGVSTHIPIWYDCEIRHDGQVEGLNHSMVMEASSLAWARCCCSSSSTSGELPPTLLSILVSSVMTAVSSAAILRDAGASRGSRGSGERKPEEFSQFWVEEETWEMTGIWTEEEDEAAVVVEVVVLPGYTGWCWDSSSSYWTPSASSSSCTWLR